MHLIEKDLINKEQWMSKDFILPDFAREIVKDNAIHSPKWIHFGAGNIFRAFPAALLQKLLNDGIEDTGLIVAEGYDYEIIDKMFKPHDNLSLLVTLKLSGNIEKTVIASIVEALKVDSLCVEDFKRLQDIFKAPTLQMASFTITEKGYSLKDAKGNYLPDVLYDFKEGVLAPKSYIGKLVSLCYTRYLNGQYPIALVSMDNCSHNGTKLYEAVHEFAVAWEKSGLVEEGFLAYISDPNHVSFPWSMIDKITPRPDESVSKMLRDTDYEDIDAIVTSKNTYIASFVNAEEAEYLVIEDAFPNGRPRLEEAGVIFTEREVVDKVEKMKVCTCLNPLHTALAVFGCLLDYTHIYKEMEDVELRSLVEKIGYEEGLKVVVDPKIIDPKKFLDEVLQVRIPNPFMPDTPWRIATDTSQKLSIRFGETLKAYDKDPELDVTNLTYIPLVLAGWCRYILGINDHGNSFKVSPDPMYDEVSKHLSSIKLGDKVSYHEELLPILSNVNIFGVNLYEIGLGEKVESYFNELVAGVGAVRGTLKKYVTDVK